MERDSSRFRVALSHPSAWPIPKLPIPRAPSFSPAAPQLRKAHAKPQHRLGSSSQEPGCNQPWAQTFPRSLPRTSTWLSPETSPRRSQAHQHPSPGSTPGEESTKGLPSPAFYLVPQVGGAMWLHSSCSQLSHKLTCLPQVGRVSASLCSSLSPGQQKEGVGLPLQAG